MALSVRKALPDDIDWLVGELRAFSAFYGTRLPLFGDEAQVRAGLASMIEFHLLLVAEKAAGDRVGFVGGFLAPHPFNPAITVLSETFYWVIPAERRSRAALRLLDAFEAYGEKHARWIVFAITSETAVSPSTLLRRGYVAKERSFLKEVN